MMKRYTHYVTLIFKKLSLIMPVVKWTFVQKNIVNSTKSSNFIHTSALALILLMVGVSPINAQVTVAGSTNANGSYTSLGAAFTKINGSAQTGNNIVITISANTSEAAATLNAGTWTTLKIYPIAPNLTLDGYADGPLFSLSGADNVTMDGRVNQTGTASLTIQNRSGNTVNVLSFSNSAQNNAIRYCYLKGKGNATNSGIILFSTSSSGTGNDGNTIEYCNFTGVTVTDRPTCAIYSLGTAGRENSANTISYNNFYNIWNAQRTSNSVFIDNNSINFTINANNFYDTDNFIPNSNYSYSFIYLNSGYNHSVTNNYLGGQASSCGGSALSCKTNSGTSTSAPFYPIYINVGTTPATSIQGNTIQNIDYSTAISAFSAIYVNAGAVNIDGNTIGATTGTQSIKINGTDQNTSSTTYLINIRSTAAVSVTNNNIGAIYTSQSYSKEHSLFCVYKGAYAGNLTVSGNTIGSEATSNSIQTSSSSPNTLQELIGISSYGTGSNTISGNTIANLNNSCTNYNSSSYKVNSLHGITTFGGSNTISGNKIHNLSTQLYLVGGILQQSTTAGTTQSVTNNIIYNNSNTNTTLAVENYGIYFDSPGNTTSTISGNYVYGLTISSSTTNNSIDGIDLMSGKINCFNNIVNLGQEVTQPAAIYGIWDNGSSGSNYIYHNTVYLDGTVSSSTGNTCAFYRGGTGSVSNVRNNIFMNVRSGGSSGKHYAVYLPDRTNLTINYNDYYVSGTNTVLGYVNGNKTTLALIKTATTQDANSLNTLPAFVNVPTTVDFDFKLTASQLAGDATLKGTVPTDYGLITRDIPTMGAWEYNKNYWLGNIDTYWSNRYNWTEKYVPQATQDVEYATVANYGTLTTTDLTVDGTYTIANLINATPQKLIIPVATGLTVSNAINITGNDPSLILIQSAPNQPNGSFIFPQSTTAYATVQMYSKVSVVGGNYNWQYFGIPIAAATPTTYSPTFDGAFVRRNDEKVQDYNGKWLSIPNSYVLSPFIGYEITKEAPTTILFSGQLVNSDKIIPLTYTYTSVAYDPGQNLLANPYTAAIDITKIGFGSNTEKTVYLYNTGSYADWVTNGGETTNTNSTILAGQYLAIPQSTAGTGIIPKDIPSMSGFLVKVMGTTFDTSDNLTISYSSVINNVNPQRAPQSKDSSDKQYMQISLKGEHSGDIMWLINEPGTTHGFDNGWDGTKLSGAAGRPQLFAMEPSGNYQISTSDDLNNTYLGFQAGLDVEDTLTFKNENLELKYDGVYLVDLVENKVVDITKSGTQYAFKTESTVAPMKRFKITTEPYVKGASDLSTQLKVFNDNTSVFVDNQSNEKGELYFYDIMGRYLKKEIFGPNSISSFSIFSKSGAYVVKAETASEKVSKRIIVNYQGE